MTFFEIMSYSSTAKTKHRKFLILKRNPRFIKFLVETKIPLRKGFYTSKLILNRHKFPLISDLITPPIVTSMACRRSFLWNNGKHEPIFIQNGDDVRRIWALSARLVKLSNRITLFQKNHGLPSIIASRSSSISNSNKNKFYPTIIISKFFFVFYILLICALKLSGL